jgi:hypothetical protein
MNLEKWDIVDDGPHRVLDTLAGRSVIEKRLMKLVKYRAP